MFIFKCDYISMLLFIFIPKKEDDNILVVFFILTLKERGDIIFIFCNFIILIAITITIFMVVIISILMVGEEKQGWH